MVKDFRDIPAIRETFPTVLPFVLMPRKDIDTTRKLLKFLPHMNHFVNFLGQELALEFLNKRIDFRYPLILIYPFRYMQSFFYRIKDISMAYARTNVSNKMLNSKGQGVIFNVATSDVCMN